MENPWPEVGTSLETWDRSRDVFCLIARGACDERRDDTRSARHVSNTDRGKATRRRGNGLGNYPAELALRRCSRELCLDNISRKETWDDTIHVHARTRGDGEARSYERAGAGIHATDASRNTARGAIVTARTDAHSCSIYFVIIRDAAEVLHCCRDWQVAADDCDY